MKVPRLTGGKQVIGHRRPMICAIPVSEETGTIMPANIVAGRTVRMAVPNSAAIRIAQQ